MRYANGGKASATIAASLFMYTLDDNKQGKPKTILEKKTGQNPRKRTTLKKGKHQTAHIHRVNKTQSLQPKMTPAPMFQQSLNLLKHRFTTVSNMVSWKNNIVTKIHTRITPSTRSRPLQEVYTPVRSRFPITLRRVASSAKLPSCQGFPQ